jgi:VWFA-related protein
VARPVRLTFLGPVFCALFLAVVGAQQKPPPSQADSVPTFRSQARVVLVDVIVSDKKGQFVPGLKAEDFTVEEDHKPQRISGFNVHRYEAPRALPAMQLPANQYTNFSQQGPGGAVTILLLDVLNTPQLEQIYARKAMVNFLKHLPPGQRVGLYVLSEHPRLVQGFTSSSDVLIAAGNSLGPDVSPRGPAAPKTLADPITQALSESFGASRESPSPSDSLGPRDRGAASFAAITSDNRVHVTLATLNALARAVSGYSGRKNLIWLSGNFPLRLDQEFVTNNRAGLGGHFLPDVRETAALLAASQVAVYPVDVKGLGVASDTFAMEDLARETGGRSFSGTNAVDQALLQGLKEGSDYYTLAYSPENRDWRGQYRKLDVKVALKGVKLTFRRGYYALEEKPFTGHEAARALATAMQPLVPVSTMLLLKAQVLPPDSEHKAVRIDYAVDSHDISFSDTPNQRKHAAVDFMSVARDGEFKNAGYVTDTVEADFLPEVYKQIMQTGFPAHQELELKPGTYILRLGVIDRGSQKIGTVDLPITIAATEPPKK